MLRILNHDLPHPFVRLPPPLRPYSAPPRLPYPLYPPCKRELYRVIQNLYAPSRGEMAEPWAKPMIVQLSTTNLEIICQIWWSKTIMYGFYGAFGRIHRVTFSGIFFHFYTVVFTSVPRF